MSSRDLAFTIAAVLAAPFAAAQEPPACAPVAPVALVAPQVLGNGSPGSVTTAQIQAALNVGGHIRFNVGSAPTTIEITTELAVGRAAVLDGGGNVTLSGRGLNRVLHVYGASQAVNAYLFVLQNITLANGYTPAEPGAGLYVTHIDWQAVDLRLVNVRFQDNDAIQVHQDWGGGGMYVIGARNVVVAGSVFEGNTGSNGGAFYSLGSASVTIVDSRFEDNTATGTGGNPGSGGNAGAIGVDGAERIVTICRTRILENHGSAFGIGFFSVGYDTDSHNTFHRVTFARNVQVGTGFAAGAYIQGMPFTIRQSAFLFNDARATAGLFVGPLATGTIENTTFYGNVARDSLGGAMSVDSTASATLVNSTVVANSAPDTDSFRGGISVGSASALTLRNVILAHNTGGNVWNPWNINLTVGGSHVMQFPQFRPPPSNQMETAAVATSFQWTDAQAAAPAWNGGPTQTAALPLASPARNAGTATGAPTVDQRGIPRDGTPDLGAFEVSDDLVFADGFESGDLAAWSSAQADAGDLSAGPGAVGPTSPGLRALVDDQAGVFVVDDTPDDEDRYRARFYFDPNGFDPGEAQAHRRVRLFLVFEEIPNRRLAAIVLRRIAGAYSLMGRTRLDDDSLADTPFIAITDGPHFVEIDWRRATGPDANNGSFQMWIDGTSVATLTGLDNALSAVDYVRLGASSVKAGASGTLHWDEFESRRQSYIGP